MNDFLWVEKYRPQTVGDCILPANVKETFQSFIDQGEIPNLLSGTAGVGKTTIAKALCNELGADYYVVNGSDEGRFLDTVRNQARTLLLLCLSLLLLVTKFLSLMRQITQPRCPFSFVQVSRFQKNCRFIFTCNFKNRLLNPYIVGRRS